MYNFLDPRLLPKVATQSAALDSYEVSNLISDNFLVKSRGFIAYTSIKPPVDIDFELLCPASISYINVCTTVGSQKTTGIEVLARSTSSPFISICQATFNEPGVVFCNSRFYSKESRPENANVNFCLAFFKANTFRTFTNVSFVKVRLLRTEKSVPCVASIEIWGRIAKICSNTTAATIHSLLNKTTTPLNMSRRTTECQQGEQFVIPDDFKDTLTCEIMTMPMTLPSGNSVDQTTLEKCISNDISYGRHGCDPFTGLKFTDIRKPVLNVALKARIDMFLIKNSAKPETYNLKRTLGKLPETKSGSVVYYGESDSQSKKIKVDYGKDDKLEQAISKVLSDRSFIHFTNNVQETSLLKIQCNSCSDDNNLYKLPCQHVTCRKCLLEMCLQLQCNICSSKFNTSEPRKLH